LPFSQKYDSEYILIFLQAVYPGRWSKTLSTIYEALGVCLSFGGNGERRSIFEAKRNVSVVLSHLYEKGRSLSIV
jgi:hypothetical protein